jgi:hypothetical protein
VNSLARLIARWRTQGLRPLPPEPKHRIEAAFAHFGARPSDQVVQMYSMIGGFEVIDENYWRLWPLDEIAAEPLDSRSAFEVLFSDYMINCWCFRLRPAAHGEMEVLVDYFDQTPPAVIAPNLAAFFDSYLEDPAATCCP